MTDLLTVLVVEAKPSSNTNSVFARDNAKVLRATTAGEAISACVENDVDLVIVDRELPGESGLAVISHLVTQPAPGRRPVTIVRTDDPTTALEAGADDCVAVNASDAELISRVKRAQSAAKRMISLIADNARLRELSLTDGLTQIANRHAFQEKLNEEFRRSQRYDDPMSIILLDVDHFKLINDQFGHAVGDEVLRHLAEVLRNAVRETDFVARYGGEEFAVLLPNTALAGALTVAERISSDVRHIQLASLKQMRITASFGVSCYPSRSMSSAEHVVKAADDAMYRAKNEGRNKISLHSPAILAM